MFPKSLHQKEISNENPISIFRILESRDFNSISIFEISFYPFCRVHYVDKGFSDNQSFSMKFTCSISSTNSMGDYINAKI
jgi:hypothetical protein